MLLFSNVFPQNYVFCKVKKNHSYTYISKTVKEKQMSQRLS